MFTKTMWSFWQNSNLFVKNIKLAQLILKVSGSVCEILWWPQKIFSCICFFSCHLGEKSSVSGYFQRHNRAATEPVSNTCTRPHTPAHTTHARTRLRMPACIHTLAVTAKHSYFLLVFKILLIVVFSQSSANGQILHCWQSVQSKMIAPF